MAGQIDIQAKAVEARIQYIEKALKGFQKQCRLFTNITSLSNVLSEQIELKNNDKIHAGTLRRNPHFRNLLDKFLNAGKAKNIVIRDSVNVSIELRQSKKRIQQLVAELEVANRELLEMNEHVIKLSSAPDAKIESYENFSNQKLKDELYRSADLIVELMKIAHGFVHDVESEKVINEIEQKEVMNRDNFPHFFNHIKKDFNS